MMVTVFEVRNFNLGLLARARIYLAQKEAQKKIREHFDEMVRRTRERPAVSFDEIGSCIQIETKVKIPE